MSRNTNLQLKSLIETVMEKGVFEDTVLLLYFRMLFCSNLN